MSTTRMIRLAALLLSAALITGCEIRTRVYRANLKLLITRAGTALPVDSLTRDTDDDRFVATLVEIIKSQTMLRRVQQRMRKTADEIRTNLSDLQVAPVRGSDIVVVTVESPSREFARDFANALAEEYLRFRDEQRAQTAESALLQLTHESNRLYQELKGASERVVTYAKEHNVEPTADVWDLQLLREERDRVRELYNALLAQLMKIDVSQSFSSRTVSVLEPAIVEPKPLLGFR